MSIFYADSPYGCTIGINNKTGPAPNYAYWTQLFADMTAFGLTWLRFQISWNIIQLSQFDPPSAWSWGPLDDAVSRCNAQGINLSFPLRGAPLWALQNPSQQATTEPWFLPDPTMLAYFATQVALRYNGITINPNTGLPYGTIQSIEIGNEDWNIHDDAVNITLNQAVNSGTSYSSLTVNKTGNDLAAGSVIILGSAFSGAQQITVASFTPQGSTSIPFNTFTASANVASGTKCFQLVYGLHPSTPYGEYYDTTHSGQVGNNPVTQPARDPYWFANVLPAVASAIRANAAPGTLIGAAAIWWRSHPNTADFIAGIYALVANAASLLDYLNIHFYSNTNDPMAAGSGTTYVPSFLQSINDMSGAASTAGDPNKKIWVTEFGWGTNANNGSSIDTDIQTQAYRYAGTAAAGPYSTAGTPGNPPFYTQNTDYLMETARKSGKVAKLFFYTLSYKNGSTSGQETDTSSLVQFSTDGLGTRTNLPAYTAVQSFIATNPQWGIIPTPGSLSFSGPATQNVTLRNGGANGSWSAVASTSSGGSWLSTTTTTGLLATDATQSVTVTVTSLANSLAPGTYTGTITYTINGFVTTLSVTLTISASGLIPSPSSLSFTGSGTQNVTLTNSGANGNWTATVSTSSGSWLSTNLTSGTLTSGATQNVTVTVNASGITAGSYSGTIRYTINGTQTTLSVTLTIGAVDAISLATSALTFNGIAGTSDPAVQSITLTNTGTTSGTWSTSSSVAWATPLNNQGNLTTGATQVVSIAVSNISSSLRAGSYTGTITYTRGTATASLTLTLVVANPAAPASGVQVVTLSKTTKMTLYQNDTIPLISVPCTDDTGTILPLTGLGATAITMKLLSNTTPIARQTVIICTGPWSITNAGGGIARYQWVPTDTLIAGEYLTDIVVQTASGPIHLDPFVIEILPIS